MTAAGDSKSPFHVRGTTYLSIRQEIDERVPGGYAGFVATIDDPVLRAFAEQVFLPVAFYDVFPVVRMSELAAEIERKPFDASTRERAARIARSDATGVYRLLLAAASPEFVASRLVKAALRYFDFGSVEVLESAKGRSVARYRGVPEYLYRWMAPVTEGYACTLLELAGARGPRVRVESARDGAASGFPLVTMRTELTWR